jgi:hypothetical protein
METKLKPVDINELEMYCDLNILQLLYDKGFRFKLFNIREERHVNYNLAKQKFNEGDVSYCKNYLTYSVVVTWLRINFDIWIMVLPLLNNKWFYSLVNLLTLRPEACDLPNFNSPQEAYLAAFNFILNNLI